MDLFQIHIIAVSKLEVMLLLAWSYNYGRQLNVWKKPHEWIYVQTSHLNGWIWILLSEFDIYFDVGLLIFMKHHVEYTSLLDFARVSLPLCSHCWGKHLQWRRRGKAGKTHSSSAHTFPSRAHFFRSSVHGIQTSVLDCCQPCDVSSVDFSMQCYQPNTLWNVKNSKLAIQT